MSTNTIHLTETARDAMQGINRFIATDDKVRYINALMETGFDVVDCGSFVSPKVIPQMADSGKVISSIHQPLKHTGIMALVVNEKGVQQAVSNGRVNWLSYPFSVSAVFLQRNLHTDRARALATIDKMLAATDETHMSWVIYLSMGFGNPYGEDWSIGLVTDAAAVLYEKGIRRMPLSDILGEASPDTIFRTLESLHKSFPDADFGLHLHTKASEAFPKLEAAWEAGVRSFETVMNGRGGCPTAADEMVGNLSTQSLLAFLEMKKIPHRLHPEALSKASRIAAELF